MKPQSIPRVIAAAAVVVAGGLVLLVGQPSDAPQSFVPPEEISPPGEVPPSPSPSPATAEPPAPSDDALVAAKVREIELMSETFRNTTFLIAIRDSGFVCNELLRVYGGVDDSAKWMVTCSEMHAYTVGVANTGMLHVAPTLQYFDGVQGPARIDQSEDTIQLPSDRPLRERLPPQPR